MLENKQQFTLTIIFGADIGSDNCNLHDDEDTRFYFGKRFPSSFSKRYRTDLNTLDKKEN